MIYLGPAIQNYYLLTFICLYYRTGLMRLSVTDADLQRNSSGNLMELESIQWRLSVFTLEISEHGGNQKFFQSVLKI